ncbi:MAG: hypothetical protein LBQ93_09660 [Treponema sp.]|jgi:hypothetical protein|nr:hypothetical protein [Treponema sp.]
MTIEQTVTIPADHRVHLDFEIPQEIPAGTTAHFEFHWFPEKEAANSLDTVLGKIWELCKDSSLTVDSFLEMRRQDKELEENKYRRFFSGEDNN